MLGLFVTAIRLDRERIVTPEFTRRPIAGGDTSMSKYRGEFAENRQPVFRGGHAEFADKSSNTVPGTPVEKRNQSGSPTMGRLWIVVEFLVETPPVGSRKVMIKIAVGFVDDVISRVIHPSLLAVYPREVRRIRPSIAGNDHTGPSVDIPNALDDII